MTDFPEREPPEVEMVSVAPRPTLTLDVGLYEEFFAGSDMSEDQKRALLEALWSIIVGFVDLGFRVEEKRSPRDEASADAAIETLAAEASDMVRSDIPSPTYPFEQAAGFARNIGGA